LPQDLRARAANVTELSKLVAIENPVDIELAGDPSCLLTLTWVPRKSSSMWVSSSCSGRRSRSVRGDPAEPLQDPRSERVLEHLADEPVA